MKPRGRFAGGRTRRGRWPLLLGALAALALLALYLSGHRHEEAHHAEPDLGAQADSLNAATRRHDWQAAEQWASRLAAAQPRNHEVLYELALSIHNRATAMTPRFGRPRPSLRLSLDRIAAEVRVMALLDSAARVSPSPEGWASAQLLRGMALEGLGLPIDALEVYRAALDRTPDLAAATVRYRVVRARLFDPAASDTVAAAERPPRPAIAAPRAGADTLPGRTPAPGPAGPPPAADSARGPGAP